jgi:ligand-binding sensor domain-containing protein
MIAVRTKAFSLVTLCLLAIPFAHSQPAELKFENISLDRGLSQSTVNAVVQDGRGFMWFGTQDGLNRFDGYAVTVYKHNAFDPSSLSDNSVWALCRDLQGNIWIGTMRGGLDHYIVGQDRFEHYRNNPSDSTSIGENDVTSLFVDSRGVLWVGTMTQGLNRFDEKTGKFTRYRHNPNDRTSLSDNTVWSICEDGHHALWVGTWNGLCRMTPPGTPERDSSWSNLKFTRFPSAQAGREHPGGNQIRTMCVTRDGMLWVGTWGDGLRRFDMKRNTSLRFVHQSAAGSSLSSNLILSLLEDSKGNLWIGTGDEGLDLFRRSKESFVHFRREQENPRSLSNDIICSLLEDESGALWIGTAAGGVNRLDWQKNRFVHYRDRQSVPGDLKGNDVWAILQDRSGALWIGTYGKGLNRIDRTTGQYTLFQHDARNAGSLSHDNVIALCESRSGDLWVGTEGGGLNRFDRAGKRFDVYRHNPRDPSSLSQDEVTVIREDTRGKLWIGTNGSGVDCYDPATHTFNHFRPGGPDERSLSNGSIMAIMEDRDGAIWVGTYGGGLNRIDRKTGSVTRFLSSLTDSSALNNSTVLSIYEDPEENLWMGTYGGGLNMLEPNSSRFAHFTEADGLPNNVIYGILPDDRGHLWLTTNKGLSRFDMKTKSFRNFDVSDGLQGNEFNQGAYFRSRTGELFVGGINGFNTFFPDSIRDNLRPPPIYLTSFKVFDKPVALPQAITVVHEIQLSHAQNFFSFEFVALNYTSPEKNRYAYMLEGLDDGWIDAGTRRYASYTNLGPQEYVFRVKGSNNDGVWNEEGASIKVVISPPYWMTWWFRFLVVAAISAILFLMYRYRVNKLLEIERIRASIATDLHDDIGSTLTEMALFSDVGLRELRGRPKDGKITESEILKVSALLKEIGSTSRNLIDAMNDIVWSIDPKNDSFDFLLMRMKTHAARVLEAKRINYEIDIPPELSQLRLPLGFRRGIFLIFKEAINNILRHARSSKVVLMIRRERGDLVMTVSDNGVGFDMHVHGDGNGLRNMRLRAESLSGELAVTSSPATGTTVILRAPIP